MAFSVTNIGTGSSVSGANFNIAVPAGGVPAGATIVVFVSDRNGSIGSQAVADSKGNTYTRITSVIAGTSTLCSVYYAYNVSALSSGDTITITKAATDRAAASALYVTGIASGDPLDSAATNTATVSNGQPSVASNTPGTANDLFLGAVSTPGASGTFTQDSTHGAWSTPPDGVSSGSGSSDRQIAGGHLTGSGTSTQTYAPTFSSTPTFASSIIIALKPSAGGITGTLNADAPSPGGDGAGTLDESGTLDSDAPSPGGDGSGVVEISGTADADAPAPGGDGAGTLDETGTLDANAPAPGGDGSGVVEISGTAGADAPAPGGDATGTLDESGTADADAPAPGGDGSGSFTPAGTSGIVDSAAPAPGGDGSGTLDESGTLDANAPAPGGDAQGTLDETGALDSDAPAPGGDAQGTLDETGALDSDAPAPGGDGSGTLDETGTLDADAPAPGGEAQGTIPEALPPPIDPRFSLTLAARSFDCMPAARSFDVVLKNGAAMQYIGPKFPWERVPIRLDFKKLLGAGETLTSVDSIAVSVAEGSDGNPSALVDGAAIVDPDADTRAFFWLTGGNAETVYEIAAKVNTSAGAKREGKVKLQVSEEI